MTQYVINKSFPSRVERTPRVLECAEAFGIGLADKQFVIYDGLALDIEAGDVVYITGQSGSGKSQMLHEVQRQMREAGDLTVASIDAVEFDERPLIDQVGESMNDAIRILSMAGINDAYLFVRSPSQLSDGQRYRFKLAKVIESGADVWIADEFGATLDRVTAQVVAFCLQRMARETHSTVLVATTHADLEYDLNPTLVVTKLYENKVQVTDYPERRLHG